MHSNRKGLPQQVFLYVFLALIALVVGILLNNNLLSSQDSSALFGGQKEFGYKSAGFLVGFEKGQAISLCGAAFVSDKQIISAAHCFDTGSEFYVGVGEFTTNKSQLVRVSSFEQKPGWDRKNSDNDFATANLQTSINSGIEMARIVSPNVSCNYTIVAYGRNETETKTLGSIRPRKSADVCISGVGQSILTVNSPDGGVCLGDSGSPIFLKGTNKIVGVVSAINSNSTDPCYVGNTTLVNRLDNNMFFLQGKSNYAPIEGELNPKTDSGFSFSLEGIFTQARLILETLPLSTKNIILAVAAVLCLLVVIVLVRRTLTRSTQSA